MRVKRSSNTVILAFFSVWSFSLTNTVLGEDAAPESNCEIIQEALYSENPERQILTLKNRKIDLNQLCKYPYGEIFESFTSLGYAVRVLDLPAIKALIKSGANVNVPDEDGMTPIFRARDLATVQFLLKAGANVNAETPDGWTPLLWHMISKNDEASRIVEVLISSGARVNQRNDEGDTALMIAADDGNNEIVRLLIKAKANLNIVNKDHNSALMIAAMRRNNEIVRLLIKAKANLNIVNKDHNSALMIAAGQYGSNEIVRLLIEAKANLNIVDKDHNSALMIAAYHGNNEIVRLLIEAKANLNIVDKDHNSALMIAARKGASKTVELLIAAGANPSLKNNSGESALDLAVKSGNREAIAHIETALKKLSKSEIQKVPGQTTDNSKVSTRRVVRIQLQDGSSLAGEIIRENDIDLILLQNGIRLLIRKSDIQKQELAED